MLNVVEVGSSVAGAWAARLLSDQGAYVVKLEPPGGDPLRREPPLTVGEHPQSGLFIATNVGKRSATADLASAGGLETLQELLAWADVLVMSLTRAEAAASGLDAARIRASHPGLVVLSITPFGHAGPHADFAACELTHAHAGGWASICPLTHPEDFELPPLKMHGHHCSMMAGVAAVVSALGVAFDTRRSGVGDFIDFSVQAYVSSVLEFGTHAYTYGGWVVKRTHPRSVAPWKTAW